MKAKTLLFLLLVGSLCLHPYRSVQAHNAPSDRQAIAMLTEFYTAYITAFSKLPTPDALKKLDALPKKYCTAHLLRKINARYQQGHVDADPFTHSQDVDLSWLNTLAVRKDVKSANSYTVSYGDGASTFKVVMHLTVLKQGDRFKIAAIN
jgi:hypothetical protein